MKQQEEKYATFPEDSTEEKLTNMFYAGSLEAVCYNCRTYNEIFINVNQFNCKDCGAIQNSPMLNEYELNKERAIR